MIYAITFYWLVCALALALRGEDNGARQNLGSILFCTLLGGIVIPALAIKRLIK